LGYFQRATFTLGIREARVSSFSYASFNQSSSSGYGKSGILSGLCIDLKNGAALLHPIDWCSNKQRRVSCSPYGAEVLACADADNRGYHLKTAMNSLFIKNKTRNELFTDSKCLYDNITTLYEGPQFRLRPSTTVQRMRNSFDSRELDFMCWIPGTINPADALTKYNPETSKLLNGMTANGVLDIDITCGYVVDS